MVKIVERIKIEYSKVSPAAKAAIWFTISNFMLKAIDVITVPIYTRLMTTAEYGVFGLFNSWEKVLMIFATLHFSSSGFNVGMVHFEKERDKFTSSLQCLSTLCTLIFIALYSIFYSFLKEIIDLPIVLLIPMFFYFLVGPAFEFWCARQRFEYKYKRMVIVTVCIAMITPIVSIISILLSRNKSYALIYSIVGVNSIVGIFFYIYNTRKGKCGYNANVWKFALAYNIPLIPHFLSRIILNQIDRVMIGNYCGNSDVALYTVAYNAGYILTLLYNSITVSYHPWNFQNLQKKNYKGIKAVTNMILLFFLAVTILLILVAPEIMGILAPAQYKSAIYVIPPVAASVYFQMLYTFFGNIEQYFMKTKFMSIASAIAAALNIFLNYIFIPLYGYYAAAYTTLVCYVFYAVGHYFFMHRIVKQNIGAVKIFDSRFILLSSIFIIVFSILINFVYQMTWVRVGILIILICIMWVKRSKIVELVKLLRGK